MSHKKTKITNAAMAGGHLVQHIAHRDDLLEFVPKKFAGLVSEIAFDPFSAPRSPEEFLNDARQLLANQQYDLPREGQALAEAHPDRFPAFLELMAIGASSPDRFTQLMSAAFRFSDAHVLMTRHAGCKNSLVDVCFQRFLSPDEVLEGWLRGGIVEASDVRIQAPEFDAAFYSVKPRAEFSRAVEPMLRRASEDFAAITIFERQRRGIEKLHDELALLLRKRSQDVERDTLIYEKTARLCEIYAISLRETQSAKAIKLASAAVYAAEQAVGRLKFPKKAAA